MYDLFYSRQADFEVVKLGSRSHAAAPMVCLWFSMFCPDDELPPIATEEVAFSTPVESRFIPSR